MDIPHRKTIRHYEDRLDGHHLTFSCVDRQPLLAADARKELLATSLHRAIEGHAFELLAFVFMPEHVHLVVHPLRPDYSIAALLQAIKKPMSFRAKLLIRSENAALGSGEEASFRFWQRGPGFDSNLRSSEALRSAIRYVHMNPVRRGLVARPEEYAWSSFCQYQSPDEPPDPRTPRVRVWPL